MQAAFERLDALRAYLCFSFPPREKTVAPPIEINVTPPPAEVEDGLIFIAGPTVRQETEKIIKMCDETG